MEKYPLLISYPRSGSNWLNCVLELYFNRPRLRAGPITFLENRNNRDDYMWFHDHDILSTLKVGHNNIIYLYRDPVDVIFSLLMAWHPNSFYTDEINKLVIDQIENVKRNLYKYLFMAQMCVRYECLKGNVANVSYYDEFTKIIKFFDSDQQLDTSKLDNILCQVTKNKIIQKEPDKKYFNDKLLLPEYGAMRKGFYNLFKDKIYKDIINSELEQFF
jgi:hypothetical protein